MAKYSAFTAAPFSVFDPGLYQTVRYEWQGTNLLYLLGLVFFITTVIGVACFLQISNVVNQEGPKVVTQLPAMTFKDGELSIDKPSPHVVKNPWITGNETEKSLAMFDTSGANVSATRANTAILFAKNYFMIGSGDEISYAAIGKNGTVTPDSVSTALRLSAICLPLAIMLIGTPVLWAGHALQALIYAVLALIVAQSSSSKLPFDAAMRLAIMAMTPVMLLSTAMAVGNVYFELWGFFTVPIVIGYIVFAVRTSSKEPSDSTVTLTQ